MWYVYMPLYVVSGVIQPILTDSLKYQGGVTGWPPTLLTLLAASVGMALVGGLGKGSNPSHANTLAKATFLDITAGALCQSGLLMVGSGVFTVVYSSTTAWTAIISFMGGHQLTTQQWLGVFTISFGLFVHAADLHLSPDNVRLFVGLPILLVGTFLHAGAFVYNEHAIRERGIDPFTLCSAIGFRESILIVIWNLMLVAVYGYEKLYSEMSQGGWSVLVAFVGLVLANATHSFAFFGLLSSLGAVQMGVLKSLLAVSVFSIAATMFCSNEASQCFTPTKAFAMVIVLFGGFVFKSSPKGYSKLSPA